MVGSGDDIAGTKARELGCSTFSPGGGGSIVDAEGEEIEELRAIEPATRAEVESRVEVEREAEYEVGNELKEGEESVNSRPDGGPNKSMLMVVMLMVEGEGDNAGSSGEVRFVVDVGRVTRRHPYPKRQTKTSTPTDTRHTNNNGTGHTHNQTLM